MTTKPSFITVREEEYVLLNHSRFQKDAVRYNMFYDFMSRTHLLIHSRDNSCIAMKNKENALWLWVDEAEKQKTDELLTELALYLNSGTVVSLSAAPGLASSFALEYCGLKGCKPQPHLSLTSYRAITQAPMPNVSGGLIRPDSSLTSLLAGYLVGFHKEAFGLDTAFHRQLKNAAAFIKSGKLYCWQVGSACVAMGLLNPYREKFARLNNIYVNPAYRGRGYGKAITAMLSAITFQKGLLPVLYADTQNSTANKLYTSLHFEDNGQIDEIRFI